MPHKPPAASPAATSEAILVRQPVRDDGTFGGAQSELSLVEGVSHWRHSQERRFVLTRLAIDRGARQWHPSTKSRATHAMTAPRDVGAFSLLKVVSSD